MIRDDQNISQVGEDAELRGLVVLVIGNVTAWTAEGRKLPETSELTFAELDEVNELFISDLAPDIVLSSIFTPEFDAIDVAVALREAGFSGRYRALTPRLPNPGLVRREVRAACPKLDFDVLVVDQSSSLRPN